MQALFQDNSFLSGDQYALARIVLVVVLGICVGSFLNVVALRSLKEESWIFKPSYCPHCETRLGILDLIPIISYLILQGKCKSCSKSISWQYPVVEAFTGLMFFLVFSAFGLTIHGLAMAFFGSVLIAVCITDFREKLIPHEITYPAMLLGIIYRSYFLCDRNDPAVISHFVGQMAEKAKGITFNYLYTMDTLSYVGFHQDLFFNTMAGIGISYIVFDYIDFYGLVVLKFLRDGDEEEEKEEEDPLLDRVFEIEEEEYDEEANIVMGGGDAVLSAVIASWLGLQGMLVSVMLAFLVGSLMGAVYLFVDMRRRKVLHTIKKPFLIGFAVGAALLSIPLLAFGSLTGNMKPWMSPQLLSLALMGGIAGGLISAIFSGSKFQARFPFGPSLAIGAAFAMFITVPGALDGVMGILQQAYFIQ